MTRARDTANIVDLPNAKGDLYAATAADTPARLGVGTDGQVLTASAAAATGLAWATAAAGSYTTIASGSLPVGSALAITSIPQTYKQLVLMFRNVVTPNSDITVRFNNDATNGNYFFGRFEAVTTTAGLTTDTLAGTRVPIANYGTHNAANNFYSILMVNNYESSACDKVWNLQSAYTTNGSNYRIESVFGGYKSATAITQINVTNTNFSAGTYILYGVA